MVSGQLAFPEKSRDRETLIRRGGGAAMALPEECAVLPSKRSSGREAGTTFCRRESPMGRGATVNRNPAPRQDISKRMAGAGAMHTRRQLEPNVPSEMGEACQQW
jgi:hypothetical protein